MFVVSPERTERGLERVLANASGDYLLCVLACRLWFVHKHPSHGRPIRIREN